MELRVIGIDDPGDVITMAMRVIGDCLRDGEDVLVTCSGGGNITVTRQAYEPSAPAKKVIPAKAIPAKAASSLVEVYDDI